jgi:hypothetical protein
MIVISENAGTTYIHIDSDRAGYTPTLIDSSSSWDFSSLDVNWVRVKNDVYLSNAKDAGYILEATHYLSDDPTFILRNANIARPTESGTDNLTVTADTSAGSITPLKWIGYAVEYVRRTDTASGGIVNPLIHQFGAAAPNNVYNPGVLESIDLIAERKVVQMDAGKTTFKLTAGNLDQLDTQVTHVRIYRTLEFATEAEAAGASLRWFVDLPVIGVNSQVVSNEAIWYDSTSNATMAGDLNFLKVIGMDTFPVGRVMTWFRGRLWVGGVESDDGEYRGRYFYSVPPLDVDFPQKWYSMFLTSNTALVVGSETDNPYSIAGFKDTDQEDDELCQVIGIVGNDIVFLNSKSVWYLADGDPETFEPELIDPLNGTLFNHSHVLFDGKIHYLSNNGPAVVDGRSVRIMEEHTAGECWKTNYDNQKGYFFLLDEPKTVRGYYVNENWILADNDKVVCNYMPRKGKGYGPWEWVAATGSIVKFGLGVVIGDTDLIVSPYNTSGGYLYKVFDDTVNQDEGIDFDLRSKSKRLYVSEKDREKFAEAAMLYMFVEFTDIGQMQIILTSDKARNQYSWIYDQLDNSGILSPSPIDNTFRQNIAQPIYEGFIGQVFEVEFIKTHKTPYDFITKGFSLENILRHRIGDFVGALMVVRGDIIETGVADIDITETGSTTYDFSETGGF